MTDVRTDAGSVAAMLAGFTTVDPSSVQPVLVTIGRKTWGGALYKRRGSDASIVYLLGDPPASYRYRKAGAYIAGDILGGRAQRFFVSSYSPDPITADVASFHPLSAWWQLERDHFGVTDDARTMSVDFLTIAT